MFGFFFSRNEAAVVAYFRAPQIGPTSSCRCASAGLNWWYGDVRVWDSGRVLALHYSQQLGLSLWPFLWLQQWPLWCWAITLWLDSGKKTHKIWQESAFRTHYRPDYISKFCMFTNAIQYNLLLKFNTGLYAHTNEKYELIILMTQRIKKDKLF